MSDAKQPPQPLRVTVMIHRHEHLSEAEFYEHVNHVHLKLVKDWLLRHGITGYSHFYSTAATRALLVSELPSFNTNADNQIDCDCLIELRMPSLSCMERAFGDPYYKEVVAPDELLMGDLRRSKITVGWEEIHMVDGKWIQPLPA